MDFKFSPAAAELIGKFEGFRAKPYLDGGGVATIGYGTIQYPNGTKVTLKDPSIDKETAMSYLLFFLNKEILPVIDKVITVDQTQKQIDALACLIYNIGTAGFSKSTLLKKINAKAPIGDIQSAWSSWKFDNGKVIPGLVSRRTQEFKYYTS